MFVSATARAADAPRSPATTQPLHVDLPDNASLDIATVGLSDHLGEVWSADGTPIPAPASLDQSSLHWRHSAGDGQRDVGIRVNINSPAALTSSIGATPASRMGMLDRPPLTFVSVDPGARTIDLRVGMPLGEAHTLATFGPFGDSADLLTDDHHFVAQPSIPAVRDGELIVPIVINMPKLNEWRYALVAVLKDGERQSTDGWARRVGGVGFITYRFEKTHPIKPEDVVRSELQLTPFTLGDDQPTLAHARRHQRVSGEDRTTRTAAADAGASGRWAVRVF
ncbi:MAG TPA: hypothetical protein VLI90_02850 [Tepidisphaeraceae bacterium]|nr:hypothetical protein [Tepidisphaeraceae bacterium]